MTACATYADTVCLDITPPVVTLNPPVFQFLQAGTTWVDPGATATDTHDGTVPIVKIPSNPNNLLLTVQQINYTATDAAGNVGFAVRSINVSDTLPPTLTITGQTTVSVEAASTYTDAGCTATDLVDGVLTNSITTTGLPINTHVTGTYYVHYSVCDLRTPPNCASATRTVIVVQTIVPVITLVGLASMPVEATTTFTDPGAFANDTLDTNLTPSITKTYRYVFPNTTSISVAGIDTLVVGVYKITYNVVNSHGLSAVPVVRTVTVRDTTPPVITLDGANPVYLQATDVYVEPGYSAVDLLDGVDTSQVVVTGANFNIPPSDYD